MPQSLDALPPLTLLVTAGLLTFAKYRIAPTSWRFANAIARYGVLALACLLSLAYTASFAPGPLSQMIQASEATMKFASLGLLGLAAGFHIVGSMLLIRRSSENDET